MRLLVLVGVLVSVLAIIVGEGKPTSPIERLSALILSSENGYVARSR